MGFCATLNNYDDNGREFLMKANIKTLKSKFSRLSLVSTLF